MRFRKLSNTRPNPHDGEHVVEVLTLPPAQAADYIEEHDQLHADVVRLAQAMDLV
jgi:8-oxo-dGTP diphosphatase